MTFNSAVVSNVDVMAMVNSSARVSGVVIGFRNLWLGEVGFEVSLVLRLEYVSRKKLRVLNVQSGGRGGLYLESCLKNVNPGIRRWDSESSGVRKISVIAINQRSILMYLISRISKRHVKPKLEIKKIATRQIN